MRGLCGLLLLAVAVSLLWLMILVQSYLGLRVALMILSWRTQLAIPLSRSTGAMIRSFRRPLCIGNGSHHSSTQLMAMLCFKLQAHSMCLLHRMLLLQDPLVSQDTVSSGYVARHR